MGHLVTETPILHEYAASGNCYKIRLTAAHVGIKLERKNYDIMPGETRTPEFLRDIKRSEKRAKAGAKVVDY